MMLESIRNFPNTCKEAFKSKVMLPEDYGKVENLIVAGMGGSAIAGNILKDGLGEEIKVPIEISQGYELPAYASENTLLICISYSGNTKETIAQLEQGLKKECKIIGIGSGGKLEQKLEELKKPFIKVPSGMVPRLALPYLLFSSINALESLGWLKVKISTYFLERDKGKIEKGARGLAKKIVGTFPIVCGTYPSACIRFKTQLNENAKMLAKYEILPELNHNEIESWINLNKGFSIIFLREKGEKWEIRASISFLKKIVRGKANCFEIFAKGRTKLERILYLIWFGDLVSCFLAKERGVEPRETKFIEELKASLDRF